VKQQINAHFVSRTSYFKSRTLFTTVLILAEWSNTLHFCPAYSASHSLRLGFAKNSCACLMHINTFDCILHLLPMISRRESPNADRRHRISPPLCPLHLLLELVGCGLKSRGPYLKTVTHNQSETYVLALHSALALVDKLGQPFLPLFHVLKEVFASAIVHFLEVVFIRLLAIVSASCMEFNVSPRVRYEPKCKAPGHYQSNL
jgi:hypothetical protein